jgi:hypothetical protein
MVKIQISFLWSWKYFASGVEVQLRCCCLGVTSLCFLFHEVFMVEGWRLEYLIRLNSNFPAACLSITSRFIIFKSRRILSILSAIFGFMTSERYSWRFSTTCSTHVSSPHAFYISIPLHSPWFNIGWLLGTV